MKISIAFLPEEKHGARAVEEFVRVILPGVKVRVSDRHPPFLHLYMTTKLSEKPCNNGKKA